MRFSGLLSGKEHRVLSSPSTAPHKGDSMLAKRLFTLGTIGGSAALILTAALLTSPAVQVDDEHSNSDAARIDIGFQVAPVHLTYEKSNRKLVGLGSYIVNVVS